MRQNIAFYREAPLISIEQPRENKDAVITGSPWFVGCTTRQLWPMLELGFGSFFTPRAWHNVDDCGGDQNTSIKGKMVDRKAKNHTKHIKELYPSMNRG